MVLSSLRESTCSSPTQPVQLDAPTSGESEAGITGFQSGPGEAPCCSLLLGLLLTSDPARLAPCPWPPGWPAAP